MGVNGKPYYQNSVVIIYHADCRELSLEIAAKRCSQAAKCP